MKRKQLETFIYSTVGVAALALILLAVNVIAAHVRQRFDLTAEKAYTLSAGTRAILARLDTPVQIRFYCTKNPSTMPVLLANYAQRVDDLLAEYKQASKGLVEIQRLNPEPDSDAEDSARIDGVESQLSRTGGKIYLGLSVNMLDQKEPIPFLAPERERLLEYDISRAIARVMAGEKPVIGVMSSLPVMGQSNPLARQRGQRGRPPWVFINELERDFRVRSVPLGSEKIPPDVNLLLVIHPKGTSDVSQYAIDQFILRGGKLVAFVDPFCLLDRAATPTGVAAPVSSSNLDQLFNAWGVNFDPTEVVIDPEQAARLPQGPDPSVLALSEGAIDKDDVVTANADNLLMAFAGAFPGTPAPGLTETVLIKSSKQAGLLGVAAIAVLEVNQLAESITPSGTEYPLAIRLTGKFRTAFPNGKPKEAAANPSADKAGETPTEPALKESAQPNTVVLVADTDMIQDPLTVTEVQGSVQGLAVPINGNLSFAQGVVEQLAGTSELMAIRSRASRDRPFTLMQKLQADAERNFRGKIKELEDSLAETQRRIVELQKYKEGEQRYILSPEQQRELASFRNKEVDAKIQLKGMRKRLRAQIDSLEDRIKWLNIAGMPAVVILFGFSRVLLRRWRVSR